MKKLHWKQKGNFRTSDLGKVSSELKSVLVLLKESLVVLQSSFGHVEQVHRLEI